MGAQMDKLVAWLDEKRGRRVALAKLLNVSPGAISKWRWVPTRHLRAVSDATLIPLSDLV